MRFQILFCIVLASPAVYGQTSVLTWHNDNARTGQNLLETTLTPANVKSTTFGRLFTLAVDGKVDAQPLYVPGVTFQNQGVHNILYVVTEHDSVYAFDADSGALLKQVTMLVGNEVPSDNRGCSQVTPEIGITGTPAIDLVSGPHGTMFLVAMSKAGSVYHQRVHSLDLTTLADQVPAVEVVATSSGSGAETTFTAAVHKARPGLLIGNGLVYTTWGSHCDAGSYAGWVISYNESTLARVNVLNVVPNGNDAGIWAAGAGPAMDPMGNVYFLTGNGTFDTNLTNGFPNKNDYGNAFVKVTSALSVVDYFTMSGTVGESNIDQDLGSGGLMLLPPLNDAQQVSHSLAVGAGKDTEIYIVDQAAMGKFNQNSNAIYQELAGALPGGAWSSPAWFNGKLYYGGVGDTLKAFTFSGGSFVTPASSHSGNSFAYPGTTPSISANGNLNGIVWAAENSSTAVLHAYDATDVSKELYNSNQAANSRDHFGSGNKYIVPTVVNGKVYVGTTTGVGVFGLLSAPADFSLGMSPASRSVAAGNSTSYTVTATASNGFSGAINFGASGLPSGATPSFNPPSVPGSGATTLTINTTAGAAAGSTTITVTGTSGSLNHNTSATLSITGGAAPPSAVSVSPSSGSGSSQTFAFVFSDANGAANIVSTQMVVNATLSVSGGCFFYFSRGSNAIYLADDAGAFHSPSTIGSAGTQQNSQCVVDAGASSVSMAGTTLTVNLALSFKAPFTGTKNIFAKAYDGVQESSWVQLGSWIAGGGSSGPPAAVSVSPNSGGGSAQTFAFAFSDANGAASIVSTQMVVNTTLAVSGGCFFYFSRGSNAIYLADDGGAFHSPSTIGSAGTQQNSQCVVDAGASSVSMAGTTLTVNLALSFKAPFTGTKGIFAKAYDGVQESSWVQLGSWTANGGGSSGPPATVSVSPNSGSGTAQTFAFTFSDANGAASIVSTQMLVNATLSVSTGCFFYFARGSNTIYLADDAGSFHSPSTIGSAGTQQNSQCTVDAGASSVSMAGSMLTVNLALSFKPAFAGLQSIFAKAYDGVQESSWVQLGSWTP